MITVISLIPPISLIFLGFIALILVTSNREELEVMSYSPILTAYSMSIFGIIIFIFSIMEVLLDESIHGVYMAFIDLIAIIFLSFFFRDFFNHISRPSLSISHTFREYLIFVGLYWLLSEKLSEGVALNGLVGLSIVLGALSLIFSIAFILISIKYTKEMLGKGMFVPVELSPFLLGVIMVLTLLGFSTLNLILEYKFSSEMFEIAVFGFFLYYGARYVYILRTHLTM